jgi:hypothetical protein
VIGNSGSTITGVYTEVNNREGDNIGGLAGYLAEDTAVVTNCKVENVTVKGTRKVGGLIGSIYTRRTITGCSVNNVTVTCTATEAYASKNSKKIGIGGLIGLLITPENIKLGTLTNCTVSNVTLTCENSETLKYLKAGLVSGGMYNHENFDGPGSNEMTVENIVVSGNNTLVSGTKAFSGEGNAMAVNGAVATATINNVTTGYATLKEAVAAVTNGTQATITLMQDVTYGEGIIVPSGSNIVFDVKGHTYTVGHDLAGSAGTKKSVLPAVEGLYDYHEEWYDRGK